MEIVPEELNDSQQTELKEVEISSIDNKNQTLNSTTSESSTTTTKNDNVETRTTTPPLPTDQPEQKISPPDSKFGWLVVFASFWCHFVALGLLYCFGV